MNAKNYAQVLIGGKIYTLGGQEDEHYLQRVASYINEKTSQLKRQEGFSKQNQDYQTIMLELNIADDYFKTQEEASVAKKQRDDIEKECYSLKHELVTTQMKLDAAEKEREAAGKKLDAAEMERDTAEEKLETAKKEREAAEMKLDAVEKELEESRKRPVGSEQELKELKEENQRLRAVRAATEHTVPGKGTGQRR